MNQMFMDMYIDCFSIFLDHITSSWFCTFVHSVYGIGVWQPVSSVIHSSVCVHCPICVQCRCWIRVWITWYIYINDVDYIYMSVSLSLWYFYHIFSIKDSKEGGAVVVIVWLLNLQLSVKSVPITTGAVGSNPALGEMYSIQHYVIKLVSDFQKVGGFLWVLRFPPPVKLTATI